MKNRIKIDNCPFDKIFFVAPGSDYGYAMWEDIQHIENAVLYYKPLKSNNKVINFLHHLHFSFALNNKITLPIQNIWEKQYSIAIDNFEKGKQYCVIYTDISACRTDVAFLKKLHFFTNVKMILIHVNVVENKKKLLQCRWDFFDDIYTFDKNDSKKYNMRYYPANYSMKKVSSSQKIIYDAFFVGNSKGRLNVLNSIYDKITQQKGNCLFYIANVKRNEQKTNGVIYNKWLSYSDILSRISETNCIVEVLANKQSGITLRTMEAIVYGKKLLTNNPQIKNTKYFKSGNIQYFSDPDDIDINFILDHNVNSYDYNDDFSPINLISCICEKNRR